MYASTYGSWPGDCMKRSAGTGSLSMYTIQPRSSMPLPIANMSSVGEATAKTDIAGLPMT